MDLNPTSPDSSPPGLPWRLGLLLFLAIIALSTPQAALLPLLDRDEPRFAEASREMLQSGNFVVPTFNHAPRYAKPPLTYWCQALAFTLFGQSAFTARLPSLLATAGTALLLAAWGASLGSRQIGLGAALSYAFCFQTIQQGRVATADALLIFFMTLTVFAGWKLINTARSGLGSLTAFWWAILVLGFSCGFLAKGPEALLPLLPLFPLLSVTIKKTRVFSALFAAILAAFLLALGLILLWAVPAWVQTNGDYWREGLSEGVGRRMVTGLQGHGASSPAWYLLTLPYYLLLFWLGALPWSPLLALHARRLFSLWKPDPLDTCLLLNAALIFLIFSLMVTKLPHYTLPAFPFLALLLARRWDSVGLPPARLSQLGWISGVLLALLTAVAVPLLSARASLSPSGTLVAEARDVLTPHTQFALADFQEPSAIWEMRRVTQAYGQFISSADALSFLNQPGPRAVLLATDHWRALRDKGEGIDPAWKIFDASGWNTAKGTFIHLTLVVKP